MCDFYGVLNEITLSRDFVGVNRINIAYSNVKKRFGRDLIIYLNKDYYRIIKIKIKINE